MCKRYHRIFEKKEFYFILSFFPCIKFVGEKKLVLKNPFTIEEFFSCNKSCKLKKNQEFCAHLKYVKKLSSKIN
jgi:hypothetical protein